MQDKLKDEVVSLYLQLISAQKLEFLNDEGKEVDLMQDINPRRNTPSRPTYESLGTSEYEED